MQKEVELDQKTLLDPLPKVTISVYNYASLDCNLHALHRVAITF
jgi:hypothetical protein